MQPIGHKKGHKEANLKLRRRTGRGQGKTWKHFGSLHFLTLTEIAPLLLYVTFHISPFFSKVNDFKRCQIQHLQMQQCCLSMPARFSEFWFFFCTDAQYRDKSKPYSGKLTCFLSSGHHRDSSGDMVEVHNVKKKKIKKNTAPKPYRNFFFCILSQRCCL